MIKNLTIVINSFIDNNIALEHLMNSLQINNNKFKTYNFIIVIGGYYGLENYKVIQENNITTIHANHNSIDFTGLITLLELYDNKISNYYLYLQLLYQYSRFLLVLSISGRQLEVGRREYRHNL